MNYLPSLNDRRSRFKVGLSRIAIAIATSKLADILTFVGSQAVPVWHDSLLSFARWNGKFSEYLSSRAPRQLGVSRNRAIR